MKAMRWYCAAALAVLLSSVAWTQESPKPGPELEILKKQVGTWDLTMKAAGMESKGTVTYKMEVGGMWLVGSVEAEMFGVKYSGKSLDSYNAMKKKYVSVWVDSMAGSPVMMEGTFDKEKKAFSMAGEGPGMDGKTIKYRSQVAWTDDDTMTFNMYEGDGKDPAFTVTYKRKK